MTSYLIGINNYLPLVLVSLAALLTWFHFQSGTEPRTSCRRASAKNFRLEQDFEPVVGPNFSGNVAAAEAPFRCQAEQEPAAVSLRRAEVGHEQRQPGTKTYGRRTEWQFRGVAAGYGCMIMCDCSDCFDRAKDTSQAVNKKYKTSQSHSHNMLPLRGIVTLCCDTSLLLDTPNLIDYVSLLRCSM